MIGDINIVKVKQSLVIPGHTERRSHRVMSIPVMTRGEGAQVQAPWTIQLYDENGWKRPLERKAIGHLNFVII